LAEALTLFEKIWRTHVVEMLDSERAIIHIDRHMLQEGTSPKAFDGLRQMGLKVRNPGLTFAVIDHSVSSLPGRTADTFEPTRYRIVAMRKNCEEFGIELFDIDDPRQGITHVIAPALGITLPGTTMVCADSHTSTNGGLGCWAWGIGTTEVRHVLANQALIQRKPKTMRIRFEGKLARGVYAKDLILHLIGRYGIGAGVGHVVEYAGSAIRDMSVEGRMTICNMSIEFGAKAGMVAVDDKTIDYVRGKEFSPTGTELDAAIASWRDLHSDDGAVFDREIVVDCAQVGPQVSWGITPEDIVGIDELLPDPAHTAGAEKQKSVAHALDYIGLPGGRSLKDTPIDVAFIGSCTNARLSDLTAAAEIVRGRHVDPRVRALVVPGSTAVKRAAEALGLDRIFTDAGFEWRESSCSMCVATNGDTVAAGQRCISTSNRNFEGRQGPQSRTHLASPAMVAAAAISGRIVDVRELEQL
jgi:3-isopropylmalate/(R)-2-methylmalate dehydratase large subunit